MGILVAGFSTHTTGDSAVALGWWPAPEGGDAVSSQRARDAWGTDVACVHFVTVPLAESECVLLVVVEGR